MEEEHRMMEPRDLHRVLNEFFKDNANSRSLEQRWLADQSIKLKGLAHDLAVNGSGSFSIKYAIELADFRLAEITNARNALAADDRKLVEEAERVKRQAAKAAA